MVNWLKRSVFVAVVAAIPFLLSYRPDTSAKPQWGFFGHKRINRIAVFTLPPQLFGFYKENIEFLTDHAVDPDKRRYAEGEAECHYIDLDHYYKAGEDPFAILPKYWKDAVSKFTEDTLRSYGIVPWHILHMKYKLQKAFEAKNIDLILKYSSEIGHYIGDAHVPLHTTENYNGQLTGQKGIHGLWESRLVEINAENYDYFVGKASYQKDIQTFAWEAVRGSHSALDSVQQHAVVGVSLDPRQENDRGIRAAVFGAERCEDGERIGGIRNPQGFVQAACPLEPRPNFKPYRKARTQCF